MLWPFGICINWSRLADLMSIQGCRLLLSAHEEAPSQSQYANLLEAYACSLGPDHVWSVDLSWRSEIIRKLSDPRSMHCPSQERLCSPKDHRGIFLLDSGQVL